jgi:hypothetical protein
MPCDRIIVMVPKHLCTGSSSSQDVQLHSVIEEIVVLLSVTLTLAKQHGQNAMFLSRIAPGEAQRSVDLLGGVILHLTLLNAVSESVREHVLEDLVFLDGGSIQLLETEHSAAVH